MAWLKGANFEKKIKSVIKAEILKIGVYSPQFVEMEVEEDPEDKFNDSMVHMEENSN